MFYLVDSAEIGRVFEVLDAAVLFGVAERAGIGRVAVSRKHRGSGDVGLGRGCCGLIQTIASFILKFCVKQTLILQYFDIVGM